MHYFGKDIAPVTHGLLLLNMTQLVERHVNTVFSVEVYIH